MRAEIRNPEQHNTQIPRRQLAPARRMTGHEKRMLDPNRGLIKLCDRYADIFLSRFVYPFLDPLWNPYSWLLERRFALAEARLCPAGWPRGLAPLRALLITDIHAGIFLRPKTFWRIIHDLMALEPDIVIVGGDLVSGHVCEAAPILGDLALLSRAPLGAWFCFGNHDYFGGPPEELEKNLAAVGIRTLKNDSVVIHHRGGNFVLGGIDDPIMGTPNWQALLDRHGPPHLLMAHNPDHFYEAEAHGVALTLSGHTHGGQIRFPNGPAIIRQSRYCLDEGIFAFRQSLLVVSRGLGSILLPIRWGADPEALLIEITAPK